MQAGGRKDPFGAENYVSDAPISLLRPGIDAPDRCEHLQGAGGAGRGGGGPWRAAPAQAARGSSDPPPLGRLLARCRAAASVLMRLEP
jgi:hypothetical protein